MNILSHDAVKNLPALYSQEDVDDPIVPCRFYHPYSDWYWFPIEFDPQQGLFFGLSEALKGSWDISQFPNLKTLRTKQVSHS